MSDSVGAVLKSAREAKRLALDKLSEQLHIKIEYLHALETDDIANLPARIYALGFVRSYAKHFGLDGDSLVEQFRAFYDDTAPPALAKDLPVNRVSDNTMTLENTDASADKVVSADDDVMDLRDLEGAGMSSAKLSSAPPIGEAGMPYGRNVKRAPSFFAGFGGAILMGLAGIGFAMALGTGLLLYGEDMLRLARQAIAGVGAYARVQAENYMDEFQSPTPQATPAPLARSEPTFSFSLGGDEEEDLEVSRLSSDVQVMIAERQNRALLRPDPVAVTRVLREHNARVIPEFIREADIEIRASAPNWLQVEDENGRLVYAREMRAGSSFRLRCCSHYIIATRDGGALNYVVNDKTLGPVGQAETPITGKIVYTLKLARSALVR